MKNLIEFNNYKYNKYKINEDVDLYDDVDNNIGEILLNVDGNETTWFYLRDAITDGLFIETLKLSYDTDLIDLFNEDLNNIKNIEDLTDLLDTDNNTEFQKMLEIILDVLNSDIDSIQISGVSEYGDDIFLTFQNNIK